MKHYKSLAWMMAIAIAGMTVTACSLDSNEPEKPIVIIDPVEKATLYACGISPSETRTAGDAQNMLFTEKDIEWFNASTISGFRYSHLQTSGAFPRDQVLFGR